jgi:SAM-dependent methyltransferase
MTTTPETFQITADQAEMYEERFVPAIFAHWVEPMLEAVALAPGQSVLDVACGTGILTRNAADRVGPAGRAVGSDLNQAMLDVAGRVRPDIEWRRGDAAALPFDDDTFDVVTCQAALFFLPDVTAALRDMGRVARPGGTVAVQVYSLVGDQPAYGPWIEMVAGHAGPDALRMLGTYWSQGDTDLLASRCTDAGLRVTAVHDTERPAYFPSVEAMVLTEVNATPLVDRLSQQEVDRIVADSYTVFEPFRTDDGVTLPMAGSIVVATPNGS